jgi:hypothetical protein
MVRCVCSASTGNHIILNRRFSDLDAAGLYAAEVGVGFSNTGRTGVIRT